MMNAQVMPSSPQPAANLPAPAAKAASKAGGTTQSSGGSANSADPFAALLAGLIGDGGGVAGQGGTTPETQDGDLDAGAVNTAGGGSEPAKVSITEATWMMLGGLTAIASGARTGEAVVAAGSMETSSSPTGGSSSPAQGVDAAQTLQGLVSAGAPGVSPTPTQSSVAPGLVETEPPSSVAMNPGTTVPANLNEASAPAVSEPNAEATVGAGSAEKAVAKSEIAASTSTSSPQAAGQDVAETISRSGAAQAPDRPASETPVASDGFDEARPDMVSQTVRVQGSTGQGRTASGADEANGGRTGERESAFALNLRAEGARSESRKVAESPGERADVQQGAEASVKRQLLGRYGLTQGDSGAPGRKDAEQPATSRNESLHGSTVEENSTGREAFELRSQITTTEVAEADRLSRNAVAEQPVQRVRVTADEFVPAVRRAIPGLSEGTRSEMQIQLVPEHLGKVTLKVSVVDGMVTARFNVENGAVKQLVESRLPELRQALETQGLRLDTVNVGLGSNTSGFGGAFSQADVPNPRRFSNALKGYDAPVEDQVASIGMSRTAAMQAGLGVGSGSVVDALA